MADLYPAPSLPHEVYLAWLKSGNNDCSYMVDTSLPCEEKGLQGVYKRMSYPMAKWITLPDKDKKVCWCFQLRSCRRKALGPYLKEIERNKWEKEWQQERQQGLMQFPALSGILSAPGEPGQANCAFWPALRTSHSYSDHLYTEQLLS